MTTLNTIIEEEKKAFDAKFREKIDFVNYCLSEGDTMFDSTDVKNFLTSAMQRAYEVGLDERDT